jgi:hypothetical protein
MPREVPVPEIRAAPRFYPIEVQRAPHFHPELGYLWPSSLLRQRLRKAAVVALIGSVIAASTALALRPHPAIERAGDEEPLTTAAAQPPAMQLSAIEALPAIPAAPLQAPPQRAQGTCDDLSTAFLSAECRSGRVGKARLARARAGHKLATVTIGRAGREPEEPASQAAAASAADATGKAPAPAAAAVPAKPKAAAKTVRKERPSQEASADSGTARGSGLASPRFVLPSLFGGADWTRSW